MHSNIYQISSSPISEDEYASPTRYYENSGDFADYIGDEVTDEAERDEEIGYLADTVKDVFTPVGRGVLAYRGKAALAAFKQKWNDAIGEAARELTADNMTREQRLFRLRCLTEETHLRSSFRVDLVDWCGGVASPIGELFVWAENCLEEGDSVYIGAVIDYHY